MNEYKLLVLAMTVLALPVHADDITVQMNTANADGLTESIGAVVITKVTHGVEFRPELTGLTPGDHGFHVHDNASCEPALDDDGAMAAAMAAGGHYDPEMTDKHATPLSGEGHRGDLPVLVADADGNASTPVQAARLSMEELTGRSLMVHVGGDNFSDNPAPSGGGGARFACGLISP